MNMLARKLREKNYFFRRLFDIWTDYLWLDKMVILQFDLSNVDTSKRLEKTDVRWSLATVKDCQAFFEKEPSWANPLFLKFIKQGDWVLTGHCGDQDNNETWDCHAACVFRSKPMSEAVSFQVDAKEGFILIVHTREIKRGLGLAASCIAEICRRAEDRGCDRLYIDISTANAPSLRAADKVGAAFTDSYYYLFRFLKKSYLFPFGSLKRRFIRDT